MTLINVEVLQNAKDAVECGFSCITVSIDGGIEVTPEAIEWLQENHYQIRVVETFGPTGIAAMICNT